MAAVTHREARTALRLVRRTRVFDLVQHAFAPQGGGRIEDAMRRVTAAPGSFRVEAIDSSPDLANSPEPGAQKGAWFKIALFVARNRKKRRYMAVLRRFGC